MPTCTSPASACRLGFRRRFPISNSGAATTVAGVDLLVSAVVVGAPGSVRAEYASADFGAALLSCLVTPITTSSTVAVANRSPTIHLGAEGRDLRVIEGA